MAKESIDTSKANGKDEEQLKISEPKFHVATFNVTGTAAYLQQRMSAKVKEQMKKKQEAGSTATKGAQREKKDFKACYEAAKHKSKEGWCGIPAAAFRAALISVCKITGYQMSKAKLTLFIDPVDGYDGKSGTPLVRIEGEPRMSIMPAPNANGNLDLRARPFWAPGWRATVHVRYDTDIWKLEEVANGMLRAGIQVGVGEGRHDSKRSFGIGTGTFDVQYVSDKEYVADAGMPGKLNLVGETGLGVD